MRTDALTGPTLVTVAARLAVWLSAAAVNARPMLEPRVPDATRATRP
jgi:hypothetical protein